MVSFQAVSAFAAGNVVRYEDSVADFEFCDFAASFFYGACCFVTEDYRCLWYSVPFGDIASADAACHNLQQELVFADFWLRHVYDAYIFVVVVDGC